MTPRQALLIELLSRPCEDGYVRRHVLRIEGKDGRDRQMAALAVAHFAWNRQNRDEELQRCER